MEWRRLILILLVLLGACNRKSHSPVVVPSHAFRFDTITDTLRYVVPVPVQKPETIRTERANLVFTFDTVRRTIQVSQIVKTPVMVRETTRTVLSIPQVQAAQEKPGRGNWWIFATGFTTGLLLVLLFGIFVVWRRFR